MTNAPFPSDPTACADAIVAIARTWIGTPYHHQAALRGVGCDCLGLIRGVYRAYTGRDAETPPPYAPDWADADGRETMLDAAARHLVERQLDDFAPGHVLIFRHAPGHVAKHAVILTTKVTMIHAIETAPVTEVAFSPWWRRRVAGVFAFPST